MFSLDTFIVDCLAAARAVDPVQAVIDLMRRVAADRQTVREVLPGAGADETILHQTHELTVVRVEAEPGVDYPPHDHTMTAVIAVLHGTERNTRYRPDGAFITATGAQAVPAGDIVAMPPDAIHSVSNHRCTRSVGLHVYLGDLFEAERNIYDLDSGHVFPYTTERYANLTRRVVPPRRSAQPPTQPGRFRSANEERHP